MNIGVGDTEMAALRLPSDILEGHLKGDGHPYSPGQGRESEERQHLLLDVDMDHLITKVIFDIIHAHKLYTTNIPIGYLCAYLFIITLKEGGHLLLVIIDELLNLHLEIIILLITLDTVQIILRPLNPNLTAQLLTQS